ncbi:hypothetical protein LOZ47_006862, partial [Ophidiomyces ophidiicola]
MSSSFHFLPLAVRTGRTGVARAAILVRGVPLAHLGLAAAVVAAGSGCRARQLVR